MEQYVRVASISVVVVLLLFDLLIVCQCTLLSVVWCLGCFAMCLTLRPLTLHVCLLFFCCSLLLARLASY